MQHIPTSETAIRKIKSEAKRIKLELNIPLAKALDIAAINAGYENYHHVNFCASNTKTSQQISSIKFTIHTYSDVFTDYHESEKGIKRKAIFAIIDESKDSIFESSEILDELVEEVGGGLGDMTLIPEYGLKEIVKLCKSLTKDAPTFIDGYAHWAGALIALKQYNKCIKMALPIFESICKTIPVNSLVSYYELSNRPFHRLAVNLLLAYYGANKDDKAKAIAEKMLLLWPNDNIGFRYLLTPPDEQQ